MHEKQFTWTVPHDDNRVADARQLRHEFSGADRMDPEVVSVLEVVVALSRRLSFDDDGPADKWAWELIRNLGLHRRRFLDPLSTRQINEISDILDCLIWRRYEPSGLGGFFPLAHADRDQRKVEVWYQMAAYLEEQHPEY